MGIEPDRPLGAPVAHRQGADPAPGQGGHRQGAHRAGADHQRRAAGQIPVEVGGGQVDGGGDHALAGPVDAGLGVRPLADPQRLLHQLVQQPAGGVGPGGGVVRVVVAVRSGKHDHGEFHVSTC